ncbi:MAG: hypothetical protein OXU66_11130 [Gammaproteobacteria bacterium]|nr:hypothetical protein [Gammaproteobacteria bacterium]
MRLYEIYSIPDPTRIIHALGISCQPNHDFRVGPLPQTDIEKKLGNMEKEIERDHTKRDIYVPNHMRNEYFDDEYEELLDDETESHLLDRDVNRTRMMLRGVKHPQLSHPGKRPK